MKDTTRARAALVGLAFLTSTSSALAFTSLPDSGPLPFDRPYKAAGQRLIDSATTGSIAAGAAAGMMATNITTQGNIERLKAGLDALSSGNIAKARVARDNLPSNSLDRHILMWAIATSGSPDVSSGEIAEAARLLAGWPGMATLRANSERALYRENAAPRTVLEAFGNTQPQTYQGAIALARAHLAVGNTDKARAVLGRMWRTEKLEAKDEQAIIREFGRVISPADHRFRAERMLYSDRVSSAERVAALAGAKELVAAFAAVTRNDKNAAKLLQAVPKSQRGAAYIFAQARHLRRNERFKEAAKVMLSAPREPAALVDPDAWWIERRVLSRELLDHGDPATAYKIAAAHSAESPAQAVDAEFHAGWYAFRGLGDARTGAKHFARIAEIADGPISLSRAYYWLGRTAEAGGPGNARQYFERAAQYGTAFYGQLAAAKLSRSAIPAAYPAASDGDRANFERRQAVQAIRRLEQAGHARRADSLYKALAQELSSPGELALLAVMAERQGNHYLALRVGKWAASRGLPVGALAHPVGAIPSNANISGAGKALAYAIARQESEFNISAKSGAGALGLLQLMPGTAKAMAKKAGMSFAPEKLTRDPAYNATLGSHYLNDQLERFNGSYVLTFAGYNAGPRRAKEWIQRYGDPRGKSVEEVVDWIERIPFSETRSYVQRVMENYQVYKMRLTGQMDIARDLVHGRRS
ncbi:MULTISPECIES: lytic transglycosylase domain-containing protein [unclassified Aminobacter]|uniref:lytic transglycosylase domain-containing protein n=1 Tax=unclassified Aminobacter TaxID=2644704 RepID=UPI000464822F|nr:MULTISPECIES: lytic transglycosylase domain-containing protein [unclassified Aminobacter]TWH34276.1 soluble lytic murein transglycosylase [Aminobacter sp. J15]